MPRIERALLPLVALVAVLGGAGCFRRTFVVVPHRDGGYTRRDTLYARRDGNDLRVVFHHDTTWRVDTVTRTDTLWRGGTRIIRDTIRIATPVPVTTPTPPTSGSAPRVNPAPRRDTVYLPVTRRDTIYLPDPRRGRDTVYLPRPGGAATGRVDTVRIAVRDTIRIAVRDTLRITLRDTIRITVRDTVLIGGGRRLMFVPPGQFPPAGACRLWIAERAPGQQARSVACAELGPIPAGAFVLFADVAWDMDHDWVAEARRSPVPPEILALSRRRAP